MCPTSLRPWEGYHAALGLRFSNAFELAYRYATLDPTSEFIADDSAAMAVLDADGVVHHTVAELCTRPQETAPESSVNYTTTVEDEGRSMDNDRVDLLFQFHFDQRDNK